MNLSWFYRSTRQDISTKAILKTERGMDSANFTMKEGVFIKENGSTTRCVAMVCSSIPMVHWLIRVFGTMTNSTGRELWKMTIFSNLMVTLTTQTSKAWKTINGRFTTENGTRTKNRAKASWHSQTRNITKANSKMMCLTALVYFGSWKAIKSKAFGYRAYSRV